MMRLSTHCSRRAPPASCRNLRHPLAAIDLVLAGGRYRPEQLGPDRVSPAPVLAGRLGEVARLLGDGLTNKAIARTLGVSPETVKSQVAQVLAVLGATNRAEAAVKARSSGID